MVSEACQQYMQHVEAAAVHSGPAQDVLGILNSAQRTAEVLFLTICSPARETIITCEETPPLLCTLLGGRPSMSCPCNIFHGPQPERA